MKKILFDAKLRRDTPQLHVLLIGVGEYPHLIGGSAFDRRKPPKRTFGLGQLTSPTLSASALADWFLATHNNPDTPLGSVDLLLSPMAYMPNAVAATRLGVGVASPIIVPPATFGTIKGAAGRWYERLDACRDNIGVFYFCGHGLEASDRYLLAADFAADPKNPDCGIINFQQTFRNMVRCKASAQCFFLDACRDSPPQLKVAAAEGKVGRPIIDPRSGPAFGRNAPIFHAAAPDEPTFGPPGEKSYFAQALLDCLNGMAARVGGDPTFFSIDHASLALALPEHVDRLAVEHGVELRCLPDGGDAQIVGLAELHRAPPPVNVLTTIFCRPSAAHLAAHLSVTDVTGNSTLRPANDPKPWRVTLRSGKHTVSATFAEDAGFVEHQREINVVPTPIFSVPISVQPRNPGAPVTSGGSSR